VARRSGFAARSLMALESPSAMQSRKKAGDASQSSSTDQARVMQQHEE
jgi:hypothetical protein